MKIILAGIEYVGTTTMANSLSAWKKEATGEPFSLIHDHSKLPHTSGHPDDTTLEVKKQRLQILQARVSQQAMNISQSMIGSIQRVLVEKVSKKSNIQVAGRTENNRWVNFDADAASIGQFVDVVITEALPNSLRGRLLRSQAAA